jgi:uncharacterized iron-regulated membrane protein
MLFFNFHGDLNMLWLILFLGVVVIPALIFAIMFGLYLLLSKRLKNREKASEELGDDGDIKH